MSPWPWKIDTILNKASGNSGHGKTTGWVMASTVDTLLLLIILMKIMFCYLVMAAPASAINGLGRCCREKGVNFPWGLTMIPFKFQQMSKHHTTTISYLILLFCFCAKSIYLNCKQLAIPIHTQFYWPAGSHCRWWSRWYSNVLLFVGDHVATTGWAAVYGMDAWCSRNCPGPTCALTHCKCKDEWEHQVSNMDEWLNDTSWSTLIYDWREV